jgi:hypothetical protein
MNSFFKNLWSFICFTLVLIGITGLCWDAFNDQGWIAKLWGVVWNAETRELILAAPVIGGAFLLITVFMSGDLKTGAGSKFHDGILYLIMLSGAYFSGKFLLANFL